MPSPATSVMPNAASQRVPARPITPVSTNCAPVDSTYGTNLAISAFRAVTGPAASAPLPGWKIRPETLSYSPAMPPFTHGQKSRTRTPSCQMRVA